MSDNVSKKMVPIVIGKERNLFFSMAGYLYLTDKYGDIQGAFKKMTEGKELTSEKLNAILDLIYAGLVHEDEEITVKYISSKIDIASLKGIIQKITEAIQLSLPDKVSESDPT